MSPISKQALAAARVLVVGDAMLDRYWHGAVERISPEAPVPVVKVTREEERIGAAANVAYNIATLGAKAAFIGVVGDTLVHGTPRDQLSPEQVKEWAKPEVFPADDAPPLSPPPHVPPPPVPPMVTPIPPPEGPSILSTPLPPPALPQIMESRGKRWNGRGAAKVRRFARGSI